VKAYWITAGVGTLVAIVGALVYTFGQRGTLGIVLFLGGLVVAIMGLVMRFVMVYMGDKANK
jgi:hypothetical protein